MSRGFWIWDAVTGVSALALMELCDGEIYAVDIDESCLLWLKKKTKVCNFSERINVIHSSVYETDIFQSKFDIAICEGLLNVIGFSMGIPLLIKHANDSGYFIIHDEMRNASHKKRVFAKNNLCVVNTVELDENVWWNDYYLSLEKLIMRCDRKLFTKEILQIAEIKKNPKRFRSIYYVLKKERI